MKTSEIISQLVEMAKNNMTSDESRMVVSFSICRPGANIGASPDQLAERMGISVVGASGPDDCILGVQQGFRMADDHNIIHYAVGEFMHDDEIVRIR